MTLVSRAVDVAPTVAMQARDLLVQEFVPHDGMVLKVYVIDNAFWIRGRLSLPRPLCPPRTRHPSRAGSHGLTAVA